MMIHCCFLSRLPAPNLCCWGRGLIQVFFSWHCFFVCLLGCGAAGGGLRGWWFLCRPWRRGAICASAKAEPGGLVDGRRPSPWRCFSVMCVSGWLLRRYDTRQTGLQKAAFHAAFCGFSRRKRPCMARPP